MSLISEALKKAQRSRGDPAYAGDGETHAPRRGRGGHGMPSGVFAFIAMGAVALVVIAVVVTIIVVKRTPPTFADNRPTASKTPVIPADSSERPPITIPTAAQNPVSSTPVISVGNETRIDAQPAEAKHGTPALPSGATTPPGTPSQRIQDFVDAIRVAGVRNSGAESKVLMNDRVFRINDIVDRSLGVRLIGVQSDTLTFRDESGAVYTKTF